MVVPVWLLFVVAVGFSALVALAVLCYAMHSALCDREAECDRLRAQVAAQQPLVETVASLLSAPGASIDWCAEED